MFFILFWAATVTNTITIFFNKENINRKVKLHFKSWVLDPWFHFEHPGPWMLGRTCYNDHSSAVPGTTSRVLSLGYLVPPMRWVLPIASRVSPRVPDLASHFGICHRKGTNLKSLTCFLLFLLFLNKQLFLNETSPMSLFHKFYFQNIEIINTK